MKTLKYITMMAIVFCTQATAGVLWSSPQNTTPQQTIKYQYIEPPQAIEYQYIKEEDSETPRLGIASEHVDVPWIPSNARVLDVGAGNGIVTKKLIDKAGIDNVCALEPGTKNDVQTLRNNLPEGSCIIPKTLQDAVQDPCFERFDVVTVFKYNVPLKQKDEFIKALRKSVKSDGIVYITSVEYERFHPSPKSYNRVLYLIPTLQKYFHIRGPLLIEKQQSRYELLELTPKQECE